MHVTARMTLLVLTVATLFAKPFDVWATSSPGFYEQVPANLAQLDPGTLIDSEPETDFLNPFFNVGSAHRILYRSTGQNGGAITVGGMVFVPPGAPPPGGWPVVSWGHGTSGVGDLCNPSRWPDLYEGGQWRGYQRQIDRLLGEGYLVVATDYEGLGTPGLHTYLLTDALGRATIDSVRAARQLVPAAGTRWAATGHSEGGQAVLGAGELVASYGQGLTYLGAVAFAPSHHQELGPDFYAADMFTAPYLAYLAVGMRSLDPSFSYDRFVGPHYADRMTDAENHCFSEWFGPDNRGLQPTPATALNPNWTQDPVVQQYFAATQVAQRPNAGPVIVLQGTADGLYPLLPLLVDDMCTQGTTISYQTYNMVNHDKVLEASWPEAAAWLADRFANVAAPNMCPP